MGMIDWFKSIVTMGNHPSEHSGKLTAAKLGDVGEELAGLNFKTAIDAHMKWKLRLEHYINGTSTEDLKVDVVCKDNLCPLGKWIYDKGGEKFGYSETFSEMKDSHTGFHRSAGSVLAAAQANDTGGALKLLHSGDYVRASERVKMLLARLFVMASEGKEALDSHIRWKARLKAFIKGESKEKLQLDIVGRDDQCTLGQWIYGIGGYRFSENPAFEVLKARHAHFHRCASEVLAIAAAGNADKALHMLEHGAYPDASDQVAAAIVTTFA